MVGEPACGMPRLHRLPVLLGHEREHPVGLGDKTLDLALAGHDHGERRALDPAHGQDILAAPAGCEADEPGQRCSPHQVDDLPGLPGGREREIEFGRALEG